VDENVQNVMLGEYLKVKAKQLFINRISQINGRIMISSPMVKKKIPHYTLLK
jgi:hypothetical protein